MPPVATVTPPNNLPHFLTTFIGRTGELAQVEQQLSAGRLVTLTGPAGAGKTRLALQVAEQLLPSYPDGVWWCDLAALTDPAFVPETVAAAMGLPQSGNRAALEGVIAALATRQSLLVLDNCEHLLAACASLSQALLRRCPTMRILATSLQPLGLPPERIWPVAPLSLDQAAGTTGDPEAVVLFEERARHVLPSFQLSSENRPAVLAICRQLDGLPLAIELAAARIRLLSAQQIAARLGDAFRLLTRGSLSPLPRHQTLRAAIEWSAQVLSDEEHRLLLRLAVFAGSFTLEMVRSVCGEGEEPTAVLDWLDALADKSFVLLLPRAASDEAHCRLLEVIRQYAREQLEASGDATHVRDRYLDWCIAWAEQAAPKLTGPQRGAGIRQFAAHQEHIRAALRWACTAQRLEAGLRLAGALSRFWMTNGLSEGHTWLEELLRLESAAPRSTGSDVTPSALAWARLHFGRLAARLGDDTEGLQYGRASLEVFRSLEDTAGQLAAINLLALASQDSGDYARAEAWYGQGLELSRSEHADRMTAVLQVNQGLMYYEQQDFRRAAPIWSEAYASIDRLGDESIASRDNLACLYMMQGELPRAEALLQSELQRRQQAGDSFTVALILMDLGEVARRGGDLDRAHALLERAQERQRQLGDRLRLGETLANLGSVARNRGDYPAARTLYEESLASLTATGYTRLASQVMICQGLLAAAQRQDDLAQERLQAGLTVAQQGGHRLNQVEALEGLAGLLAGRGEFAQAARWLAVTEAARLALGAPIPPVERADCERRVASIRAALGEGPFAGERAKAASLSVDQLAAGILLPTPKAPRETAIPPLRVLALGPARVMVGSRDLAPGDWTYAKSKELLFFLLTVGPVSKEEIGLSLWPDASPAQLRASFHTALHHLRRALGRPDWIVHRAGEYALNDGLPLDYDVRSFEQYLRQAKAELKGTLAPTARLRAIGHLQRAADLWRGEFLADVPAGEWMLFQREALRRSLLDSLIQLGDLLFSETNYQAAAAAYQQVLRLDGYIELAHRGMMRCYARQGEAGQAVRQYEELSQLLRQELSTLPSTETTVLFDRIRRGDDI